VAAPARVKPPAHFLINAAVFNALTTFVKTVAEAPADVETDAAPRHFGQLIVRIVDSARSRPKP
jgi:hypothetical protein